MTLTMPAELRSLERPSQTTPRSSNTLEEEGPPAPVLNSPLAKAAAAQVALEDDLFDLSSDLAQQAFIGTLPKMSSPLAKACEAAVFAEEDAGFCLDAAPAKAEKVVLRPMAARGLAY